MKDYVFTVAALLRMRGPLKKLMLNDQVPTTISFDLQLMLPRLNETFTAFETQNNNLIVRFGTPVPSDPASIEILPTSSNFEQYQKEYLTLVTAPVKISGPEIPEAVIRNLAKGLSAFDIQNIREFIPELAVLDVLKSTLLPETPSVGAPEHSVVAQTERTRV